MISIVKLGSRPAIRSLANSVELLNAERGAALLLSAIGAGLVMASGNVGRVLFQTTGGVPTFMLHAMWAGSIIGGALGLTLMLGYGQHFRNLTREHHGVDAITGKIYRMFGWSSLGLALAADVIAMFV